MPTLITAEFPVYLSSHQSSRTKSSIQSNKKEKMHSQSLPPLISSEPESKVDEIPSKLSVANGEAQDKSWFSSKKGTCEKTANSFYHHQRSPSWKDLTVQKKREKSISCYKRAVTIGYTKQFGVPVNGFHPQWSASPNLCLPSPLLAGGKSPSSFSANQKTLNEKILEMIGDFKRHEKEKSKKRIRLGVSPLLSPAARRKRSGTDKRKRIVNGTDTLLKDDHIQPLPISKTVEDGIKRAKIEPPSCISPPNRFTNLYGDIFLDSDVPQLIATSGGRVIAWNDTFLRITGLSSTQISTSMSVFSLIIPSMIPRLFELFGLALRAGSPHPSVFRNATGYEENVLGCSTKALDQPMEKGNADSATNQDTLGVEGDVAVGGNSDDEIYASMTLPCIRLAMADTSFHITLALMDDLNPNKCCFYCVLSRANKATDNNKKSNATSNHSGNNGSSQAGRNQDAPVLGEIRHLTSKALAHLLCS